MLNLLSVYSSQRALMALLLAMIVTEDDDDDDSGVSENVFTVSGKKNDYSGSAWRPPTVNE